MAKILGSFVQAMVACSLRLVFNTRALSLLLGSTLLTRDGESVPAVLARDAEKVGWRMAHLKDTPWSEIQGRLGAINVKELTFPELPGWEFHVAYESERGIPTDIVGTVSAHYQDGSARDTEFCVPTLHIWGIEMHDGRAIEVSAFIRRIKGTCPFCGSTEPDDPLYGCPGCGAF